MKSARVALSALFALLTGCATFVDQQQQEERYSYSNPEPLEGSIFTDRPSFGAGTRTVPVGRLQIETGYTFAEDGGSATHSLPNTLVRTGLTDRTELNVSTPGLIFAENGEDGFGDIVLGARYETVQQDGLVPELALQASVSLPTGGASDSDSFNPGFLVPMAWSIDEKTGVLVNVGVLVQELDATRKTEVNTSTSALMSRTLSDTVAVFGEYFATYPGGAGDQHALDFGASWLLSPNLQLDAAFGFGLNSDATDSFGTVGVSTRF